MLYVATFPRGLLIGLLDFLENSEIIVFQEIAIFGNG
jgi:hypothetical protein